VTFNLPDPLLRKFKIYAATQNRSMTSLAVEAIENIMSQDEKERQKRKQRFLERLRNPPGRGTGVITWTRDELYER
jgi:hypothetical protein